MFCSHPAALLPLQCCLKHFRLHSSLKLDGGLALHVHLACKSIMVAPLPHSWSSQSFSVAALHVINIAEQHLSFLSICTPELGEKTRLHLLHCC